MTFLVSNVLYSNNKSLCITKALLNIHLLILNVRKNK